MQKKIPAWFCCLILLAAPACAPMANVARQQPTRELHTPAAEPMLILVENYRNPGLGQSNAIALARFVHTEFARRSAVPLVSLDDLEDLRQRDPSAYRQMNIAAIGRAVNARQVLYVDLVESRIDSPMGGHMIRGSMRVQVRIVDAQTGATRWPDGSEGHPLTVETQFMSEEEMGSELRLHERMNREMATRITQLFHPHRSASARLRP